MHDAVVLAGGAARRLGGVAKPQLRIGATRLLDHALLAVHGAGRVVVVGPHQPTCRPVVWARENPVGAGPVAALAAGVTLLDAPVVLVLAADLPDIAAAVAPLLAAVPADGVAVLVDPDGRRNPLAAAWRTAALRAALEAVGDPVDVALRRVLAHAPTVVEVPDDDGWGRDCDTWEEVAQARARAADQATRSSPE